MFGPHPDPDVADALQAAIDLLKPPEDVDPLHARARAAIDRLGLDGSRLELALTVFGWGSDEANGSLLGLVRKAWGREAPDGVTYDHELGWGWSYANGFDPWEREDLSEHWPIEDVGLLHVLALEAKAP